MKLRLLTVVTLLFFVTFGSLFSQENPLMPKQEKRPILLGPIFGYNRVMHTVELPSFADDALCPSFSDGQDNGVFFGFSFEYLIGDITNSNQSIILRAMYSTLPSYLEVAGDDYPSEVIIRDPQTNEITDRFLINSSTIHTNEISYDVFATELLYKINPFGNSMPIGFTVGPTVDMVMTKDWDQQYKLTKPLNVQFEEEPGYNYSADKRTIYLNEGEIEGSSSLRIGLKLGVQYEVEFIKGWMLIPNVSYNLGITDVTDEYDWRVNALQLGIDLRYAWRILG